MSTTLDLSNCPAIAGSPASTEASNPVSHDPTRLHGRRAHAHSLEDLPGYQELGGDLLCTTRWQFWSAFLRLPLFTGLFFVAALTGHWWATPITVFLLFASVVTFTHDVAHGSNIGPGWKRELALFLGGVAVHASGHAYRISHMQHHSVFPDRPDPEGEPARWPLWKLALLSPVWLTVLWFWAFRQARGYRGQRIWMLLELPLRPLFYGVAILLWPALPELLCFVIMVHVATWAFPLTTVWLPHHGYGKSPVHQTGTMRGWILPRLFFEATFHLEHHLYPAVPAHHLRELSRRIEPRLLEMGVVPRRVL